MFIRRKTFLAKLEEQAQASLNAERAHLEMKKALEENTDALKKTKASCTRIEELFRLQYEVLLKETVALLRRQTELLQQQEEQPVSGEHVDAKQIVNEWFYGEEVAKEVAQNGTD